MAIATRADLKRAVGHSMRHPISRTAPSANSVGFLGSWFHQSSGYPRLSTPPGTTPAVCTQATEGSILKFPNPTGSEKTYLYKARVTVGVDTIAPLFFLYDRLAHMGGLVGNVATAQTIAGFDLGPLGLNLPAARIGASDFSDVEWFLEWYTATGATAATATVNVTFADGTTEDLAGLSLAATQPAGRLHPLTQQLTAAQQGKAIRRVNSVTLSVSTGTAGNFGVTAARSLAAFAGADPIAVETVADWGDLSLAEIPNDACAMIAARAANFATLAGFFETVQG